MSMVNINYNINDIILIFALTVIPLHETFLGNYQQSAIKRLKSMNEIFVIQIYWYLYL